MQTEREREGEQECWGQEEMTAGNGSGAAENAIEDTTAARWRETLPCPKCSPYLSCGACLDFSQRDTEYFCMRMVAELVCGRLLP